MRKDFINSEFNNDSEINFIENYWSDVWEKNGFKNYFKRVYHQEEYKLIEPYFKKLGPNSKIIDAGCGLGDWVLALKNKGFNICGIDISKKTIDKLKQNIPEILFRREDIRKTSFMDNEFDIYFSWGVFEHFEDGPQKCLLEANRILKKKGLIFLSVPFDNIRQSFESNIREINKISKNERFYQYRFSKSEFSRELNKAGFKLILLKPIHNKQGTLRMLHHNFGFNYNWVITKIIAYLIVPLIPSIFISHMLFAAAVKK